MIRRGRSEGWFSLSCTAWQSWASLNGVTLNGASVDRVAHKGCAVLATQDLRAAEHHYIMTVPRELVVSLESIEIQAKSDKHLAEILAALGSFGRTTRGAVLCSLLMQVTIACPDVPRGVGVSTPCTDYVKFLPEELLPTFWNDDELELLKGTSLHIATQTKIKSLTREFQQFRDATQEIAWCKAYWWKDNGMAFDDWKQVDAMYRSRALEFPGIGDAMVPGIDMANHASGDATGALYETDENGDAVLQLKDDVKFRDGDEITITYGDEKGACEMIFSYGFIDDEMGSAKVIFLELSIPEDDPLKPAKVFVATSAPGFRVFENAGQVLWEGDFVYIACVNEEDGLEFKIIQANSGERELQSFWKEVQITEMESLKTYLQNDPMWHVFQLRAIVLLQGRVKEQLELLQQSDSRTREEIVSETIRDGPRRMAARLRELELDLLERAYAMFEEKKTEMLESPVVKKYLGQEDVD
ncbi:SET domain-containing protein [Pseudovirgaria hyperparasitica]|uniref:SET domain-containing protein n=1 Tax=Pseudovirgaria hyperparasitica TaxID=470096 RepID=A0A6A6W6Z5_9PEZI|nr:SET domain-containing protein [Pseudovirgaria hyperparasitica]KAF2758315.1 SET domain-containing protein [Pseudovirgaria hyperparasitica]